MAQFKRQAANEFRELFLDFARLYEELGTPLDADEERQRVLRRRYGKVKSRDFFDVERELDFSGDEQLVCISENDACGVDAIQALLGCSVGKGNLLFHMRGKQAFSFYNRTTGKSVRLVLRDRPEGMTREESFNYFQAQEPADLFDVKPATIALPEKAKLFDSYRCACCGETAGANWIRLVDGQTLCLDCAGSYDRFDV